MTALKQQLKLQSYRKIVKEADYKNAVIKRIIKSFFAFNYLAAGIIAYSCVSDIMYGSGPLVHPVWNSSYNWLPLIAELTLVSLFASAVYSLLPKISPSILNLTLGQASSKLASPISKNFKEFAIYITRKRSFLGYAQPQFSRS